MSNKVILKKIKFVLVMVMALGAFTTVGAKKVMMPKMYMFGLAASFNDTIVHFTDIQEVDSTWIETKNKFLAERDNYSYQMRNYLEQKKNMPQRTCIVFYNKKRSKLEKKYLKMKRLYALGKDRKPHYDIRYLNQDDFHFQGIDPNIYTEEEITAQPEKPKGKKGKKRGK